MEAILYELNHGVATVTLNRPAQKNALSELLRNELAEVVRSVQRDSGIRALVLAGAGGAFCAGGDLRNIASAALDNAGWHQRFRGIHAWLAELLTLDRPVIAAVDGPAFGAGFSLHLRLISSLHRRMHVFACRSCGSAWHRISVRTTRCRVSSASSVRKS